MLLESVQRLCDGRLMVVDHQGFGQRATEFGQAIGDGLLRLAQDAGLGGGSTCENQTGLMCCESRGRDERLGPGRCQLWAHSQL